MPRPRLRVLGRSPAPASDRSGQTLASCTGSTGRCSLSWVRHWHWLHRNNPDPKGWHGQKTGSGRPGAARLRSPVSGSVQPAATAPGAFTAAKLVAALARRPIVVRRERDLRSAGSWYRRGRVSARISTPLPSTNLNPAPAGFENALKQFSLHHEDLLAQPRRAARLSAVRCHQLM